MGESFKDESVDPMPEEIFTLLPLFWHAMLRQEGCDNHSGESWFPLHCSMSSDASFGVPSCIPSDERHLCLRNRDMRAS